MDYRERLEINDNDLLQFVFNKCTKYSYFSEDPDYNDAGEYNIMLQ